MILECDNRDSERNKKKLARLRENSKTTHHPAKSGYRQKQ